MLTDPEQITALAREYGEYVANNPIVAPYLDTDEKKDINIRANTRRAKDVIKWMTDRYCLVEKEAVRKEFHEIKLALGDGGHSEWEDDINMEKEALLKSLFPDLGKEAEG